MKHITDIKENNKKAILRLLYKKQNMSKKRIALELKLSASVITKLCAELMAEGILVESDVIKTAKAGRKEIQIMINSEYKRCIGVILNHKTTTVMITDLSLGILDKRSIPTGTEPEKHMDALVNLLSEAIVRNELKKDQILGIGISIKGNTDGKYAHYGIWNRPVEIKDRLEQQLGIPVALDNGIRCSAMHEQLYSDEANFIFIKYMEPGIGGAVIQDGQIKHGETHAILDFGHMMVEPGGDYCPICKRRGCLESVASFETIMEYARVNLSKEFSPGLWEICNGKAENITMHKIIEAADAGCIQLNKILRKAAGYFAFCVINTYAILDIKKIICIGELFSSVRFTGYLKSAIYEYQLTPIYDNMEFHVHENVLLSAAVLAINQFLL